MGSHFPGVRVAGSLRSKEVLEQKLVYRKVNNTDRVMRRGFGSCYEWEALRRVTDV